MQWMMLQQDHAEDFVIATGKQISVRRFVELACTEAGISVVWSGKGFEEIGTDALSGQVIVRVDPRYFRPTEVETLLGDPTKAKQQLGWVPEITVEELCHEMMVHDLEEARRDTVLQSHGFKTKAHHE